MNGGTNSELNSSMISVDESYKKLKMSLDSNGIVQKVLSETREKSFN